jgi:hypothetical protein
MSGRGSGSRRGALVLAGAVLCAVPAAALSMARIAALDKLERGRWQVRELNGATRSAALCLGDPAILMRFEHRGAACRSDTVADGAAAATVQYSCPGRGFGHSKVRVETPRLVRVDTQGLSQGRPFSYRLEARRIGAC